MTAARAMRIENRRTPRTVRTRLLNFSFCRSGCKPQVCIPHRLQENNLITEQEYDRP